MVSILPVITGKSGQIKSQFIIIDQIKKQKLDYEIKHRFVLITKSKSYQIQSEDLHCSISLYRKRL